MKLMKSGELARRCDVNKQTLRFYERKGLLPPADLTVHNYRLYNEDDARRILFIKKAQGLGFSLDEIGELLSLKASKNIPCADVRRKAQVKLTDIAGKIRQLEAMQNTLSKLVEQCGNTTSSECPILDSLELEEESKKK